MRRQKTLAGGCTNYSRAVLHLQDHESQPMPSTTTSTAIALLILVGFIASAIAYWRILKRADGLTTADRVERFSKIITTLAAILASLLAFFRYLDQRELELETRKLEFAQTIREFNLQLYSDSKTKAEAKRVFLNEATDLVATLATQNDLNNPTATIALDRFERLYHGQLVLYENVEVSDAMIDFRDALLKWKSTGSKPSGLGSTERTNLSHAIGIDKRNSDFMRQLSLNLSNACNDLLSQLQ